MIKIKFTIWKEGNKFKLRCDGRSKGCIGEDEEALAKAFIEHVNSFNTDYKTVNAGIRTRRLETQKATKGE
jgi:hypothetical protein